MEAGEVARDPSRVRVAFIAGTSWCGSTLLEQALAQIDGCSSVGEPFWLWDPDWPFMLCECGREYRSCDFWQTVLVETYGSRHDAVRADIRARSEGLWHHSILPTLVHSRSRFNPAAALGELGAMVAPMYTTVAGLTGATTIVDASKAGLWGLAISCSEAVDLSVVHLVRDPMGYVASDGRRRELPYPPGATRPARPPIRSLITWLLLNLEADLLTRREPTSLRVRYEDFVRAPVATSERVARAVGIDADLDDLFVDGSLVVRRTGHAVGGNPRRPKLGETAIARGSSGSAPSATSRLVRHTLLPVARDRYQRYSRSSAPPERADA